MDTAMIRKRAYGRKPLAALGTLTVMALIGIAGALLYVQAIIMGDFKGELLVFLALSLLIAGLVAGYPVGGWRWTPLLGAFWSSLVLAGNREAVLYDLTHPHLVAFHNFTFMVISVAIAVVGIAAGIGATVQNYRGTARPMPHWFAGALAALASLCLGAILVALTLQRDAGVGVSSAVLDQLPVLTMSGQQFGQQQISAQAGEMVALRLANPSDAPHDFTIDELDVQVEAPMGKRSLVLFKPTQPGSYTFYCSVPGHRELGMEGTLIGIPPVTWTPN